MNKENNKAHLIDVLKGSVISLMLKVIAALLGLIYNWKLAHLLGVEGVGQFLLAFMLVSIVTVVVRFGTDNLLLKISSKNKRFGGEAVSYIRSSLLLVSVSAIFMTVFLYCLSPYIAAYLFSDVRLSAVIRILSFSILPWSLLFLYGEVFKGRKELVKSQVVNGVAVPLLSIGFLFTMAKAGDILSVAMIHVVSVLVSLLGVWFLWKRTLLNHESASRVKLRRLISEAKFFFQTALLSVVIDYSPILLLGILVSNSGDVGLLGIANRVALLMGFIVFSVNSIVAPKMSRAHAEHDFQSVCYLAVLSSKLMTILVLPLSLFFMFNASFILDFFGEGFDQGGSFLVILLLGQVVNASCGSVGFLLNMTGHDKDVRRSAFLSACASISLSLLFIPMWGGIGAAIAVAMSISIMNLVNVYYSYRRLGITPLFFVVRP